jgi:hypothetical protein
MEHHRCSTPLELSVSFKIILQTFDAYGVKEINARGRHEPFRDTASWKTIHDWCHGTPAPCILRGTVIHLLDFRSGQEKFLKSGPGHRELTQLLLKHRVPTLSG